MSDVETVLGAYPRIHFACRSRPSAEAAMGLSSHQARILAQLDREDPVMVTELADFLGVTASTMSLNLTRLERRGLVSRARDPEDRRVMNVLLTEEGERARAARSVLDPERVHGMLQRLRPHERRRAVDGLALLAEAADALVARRGGGTAAPGDAGAVR